MNRIEYALKRDVSSEEQAAERRKRAATVQARIDLALDRGDTVAAMRLNAQLRNERR